MAKNAPDYPVNAHQAQAMNALFDFAEAMEQGQLSIADLEDVFCIALQSGHQHLQIMLAMAQNALLSQVKSEE